MAKLFSLSKEKALYAPDSYPRSNAEVLQLGLRGTRNQEMRALTIAAFRVSQNDDQLSTREMDGELLLHLLAGSTTALRYWFNQGRLLKLPATYALTASGIVECQDTLLGRSGAYSTTEDMVQQWTKRLTQASKLTRNKRVFAASAWATV